MTTHRPTLDAYCTSGPSPTVQLTGPDNAPVILVLGGISAKPDLSWWPELTGVDSPLDPSRFRILSTNWLIAPNVTTQDQARWILDILDELEIPCLHAAIGCSYGGMVALALAELAPERVGQLIAIGAAHRPHPLATAWRWIQRQITALGDPGQGLALARALAMTSYRSDRELDARFADQPEALESWLNHHGQQFTERFTEDEFIALSSAIDRHKVSPEAIETLTTVIGFDSDLLAPPWLLEEMVSKLPTAQHIELSTLYGHDGFLKETDAIAPILSELLSSKVEVAA